MRIGRRFKGAALALLFLMGASTSVEVWAQNTSPSGGLPGLESLNPMQQLRQRMQAGGSSLALEGAVDANAYIIGPGDQFAISVGGAIPMQSTEQVGADGTLIIPDLGAIDVSGRSLADVRRSVEERLQAVNRNVPVAVRLASPRQFFVHVSGAVPRPGRYLAVPVARVSDVLEDAYNSLQGLYSPNVRNAGSDQSGALLSVSSERPQLADGYRASFRSVTLTRRDGTVESIDLYRYFATGDTDHNPYVLDGDVINVDAYHIARDAVRIAGDVAYEGMYPYRPGDTVVDVLRLSMDPSRLQEIEEVRVVRRGSEGNAESFTLNVQQVLAGSRPDAPLMPADRISLLAEDSAIAYVNGWVEHPGPYPIRAGETTLRQLVAMAGGLRADANIDAAFMTRGESQYFKGDGRTSDLDFFSRAYLHQSRQANRFVVNVAAALRSEAEDVVLYNGDRIVFPPDEGTVFVTGNVAQPGYVPYVPGQNAQYYIDLAGGQGADSRGIYVFEQNTGETRHGANVPVVSGTTIFVDRRPVAESPEMASLLLSDQASRRQARIATTQTIITGISAITSIITAYVAITR